jgi:isoleucyl-tRNA synthetase
LIASGNIREVIRAIQERRKSDGFDISDRITIKWNALEEHVKTIEDGAAHIAEEVLATAMVRDSALATSDFELGLNFEISKA